MTENKSHDPGWNDPPIFTYDRATEIQANAAKKGTHLKKRVPFPLSGVKISGGIDPTVLPDPVNLSKIAAPPTSISTPPLPKKLPPVISEPITTNAENLVDQLHSVLHRLRAIYDYHQNDDISKRIKIMENMWLDGNLNEEVRKKIVDLSIALQNGDCDSADHLQKSLMVDHVTVCSTWMGGIRQLINQKREA